MGFLKLKPSIGIEFDTYHNAFFGDPKEDHIAVLENGNISHKNQSFQPIILTENIEDCKYHAISLEWNAKKHILSMTLDGQQILQYKKDIVKEIFKGEHRLYWGLGAATGSDYNSHKVCFDNLEMVPAGTIQQFSKLIEVNLKRGNFVPLDHVTFEGSQLISDISTNIQLEKLVNFLKDNTDKHLDIFGHVHESSNDQDLSMKRARILKKYLVSKGIEEDRLKSIGLGSQYSRKKLDLRKGLSNTRIEIYLFEPLP